jgi:hypothetical protein
VALILLAPKVVEETKSYFDRRPWESQPGAKRPAPGGVSRG